MILVESVSVHRSVKREKVRCNDGTRKSPGFCKVKRCDGVTVAPSSCMQTSRYKEETGLAQGLASQTVNDASPSLSLRDTEDAEVCDVGGRVSQCFSNGSQ
jgi:hypothetical protein